MLRVIDRKIVLMLFVAADCGCTAPRAAPPTANESSARTPARTEIAHSVKASDADVDTIGTDPDMTGVLDKLQQVRAIDPAAEQKLLEELRRTPSKSWPLVAEQFRASLAYREQVAKKNAQRWHGEAPPETMAARAHVSADASPPQKLLSSVDGRPSAPIGGLGDPRTADSDGISSEALAQSTPYSTPSPVAAQAARVPSPGAAIPAAFAADGPIYPIANQAHRASDTEFSNVAVEVQPARFDAIVEQAAAKRLTQTPGDNELAAPIAQDSESDWQQLVGKAAEDLESRVVATPTTTAEVHQHVSLRILRLLAGDTDKALEQIPHIAPSEQDYWSRQLFALATYLDHHSQTDDKRRAAASVTHLDEAVSHLRELGSLSLRNLSFSRNVYGYGAIEPYDGDCFSPGQQVSLYVEVENYHSRSTAKGYCTQLGSTYELLDEDGKRVGGGEFPDVEDYCRSRRRDFHIQFGLSLPEKLSPGQYRLQVVVKDRQSDKIGNASIDFEIRGKRL